MDGDPRHGHRNEAQPPGHLTTVDGILEEIIAERKGIRDEKISGGAENVDENLVDVLIGLQGKGGFGFHLDNSKIKAIILVRRPLVRTQCNSFLKINLIMKIVSNIYNTIIFTHAGHVCRRNGDIGVGHGVGDVGADAEPLRDEKTTSRNPRSAPRKTTVTEADMQAGNLRYLKMVIRRRCGCTHRRSSSAEEASTCASSTGTRSLPNHALSSTRGR